jgi:hypothetical protein
MTLAAGPPSPRRAVPTGGNAAPQCDPDHGTAFALPVCCTRWLQKSRQSRKSLGQEKQSTIRRKTEGQAMSGYSILILICSTTLSHADCQATTAVDVVRGPMVDNAMMCAMNAQTMIARTDLVQADGTLYMKVVCTPSKNADEWMAEIEARKAALQPD